MNNPQQISSLGQVSIDLHSTLIALSGALDLVGVDEVQHGKRVGMMARQIAQALGWSDEESYSILVAGLLHDCGVSTIREHRQLTETLEWDGAEEHCIRGENYLAACPLLADLAPEIRYHHTRWEQLLTLPVDERVRHRANLLYLADRVDILQVPFLGSERILVGRDDIIARIRSLSGCLFAAEWVEAFAEVAQIDAFWLAMEPDYLDEDLRNLGLTRPPVILEYSDLKAIARLFSRVVDAKSHYTEEHSLRVARIARGLAEDFGFRGAELDEIEIAGLLHDIGKLRVSEDIIEKPGRLTAEERACIHRHSYDTYRILKRVFDHTRIPVWAGLHHENLLGEGYPFKVMGVELDLVTRIISVADIFQALAQDRPYRSGRTLAEIVEDLQRRVREGELDPAVVAKVIEQGERYFEWATRDGG